MGTSDKGAMIPFLCSAGSGNHRVIECPELEGIMEDATFSTVVPEGHI